jgi:hypothetical protein
MWGLGAAGKGMRGASESHEEVCRSGLHSHSEREVLHGLLDDCHEMVAQLRRVDLAAQWCAIIYPSIIPRTRPPNPLLMYGFTLAHRMDNVGESLLPVRIGQRQSVSYRRVYFP